MRDDDKALFGLDGNLQATGEGRSGEVGELCQSASLLTCPMAEGVFFRIQLSHESPTGAFQFSGQHNVV
jgi:hypothetical protein